MASLKKKVVITCVAVTAAALVIMAIPAEKNFVVRGIKSVFTPSVSIISAGSNSFDGFKSFILEMQGYRDENKRLLQEISELKQSTKSVGEYKKENERLTELLDLKNNMDDFYHSVPARIISYEPNNWYDTLVINKGTYHGVKAGDAVICTQGIVGKVVEAGVNWAKISSMLNKDNAIGVRNIRTGDIAVVEGDDTLVKDKYCRMSFIDKNSMVTIGDMVETSGSGGVYPEGQIVGTVKEMKSNNAGADRYAVIEPAVNFSDLYEVVVLSEK